MANKAGELYIRNKVGYRKPPKKLADLPQGETFVLFWYEGKAKKAKAVGRFADEAQTALINKEAALRRTSLTGAVPAPAPEPEKVVTSGRDFTEALNQYLSEVKRGKSKKAHLARNITLDGFSKVCKARTIEAMSRADVLKYTDLLRGSGLTPRTIANRLAFLKTSFKHFNLAWPMLKTDRVKFTEKTVEAYSLEELKSLFAAANQEEFELLQFLLGTGVREPRRAHRAGVYGRSADEAGTREGSSAYDRGGNADLEEAAGFQSRPGRAAVLSRKGLRRNRAFCRRGENSQRTGRSAGRKSWADRSSVWRIASDLGSSAGGTASLRRSVASCGACGWAPCQCGFSRREANGRRSTPVARGDPVQNSEVSRG